jgi:hypothetical protein
MKFTKQLTLALAAVLVTGSALANGYATYEYSEEENRATSANNIANAVVVGMKTAEGWDYSLKSNTSQTALGSGSISSGLEVRAKKSLGAFYLGGRLGESIKSTTHFSYYAVDAGVKFPLVAGFTGDVGGRYRNAFDSDTNSTYETQRVHATVGYALTKKDAVAVRFSRSYGDEEKDAWRLSYTRSF